ncbi:CRISPR-associated protein Cas5 [Fodinisporobacter ferrooxydans]|uniref:CRISPR-associated protein Cas5 n=1 Tax=Fodinisporobacter ferrooxydans TaxID=2901836 RepID=A0ABY4CPS7_9BACL|nr:CRISPR-associated protein Cas5 [Alicyclobacillaceae bacterium MYW30-H2]
MDVLTFRAKVPYECGFRKETAVNTHPTYPLPPFTAWTGLIANALGFAQDVPLPWEIQLAQGILQQGSMHQSLTLIHKRAHPSETRYLYQSTLVSKERIYYPAYEVMVYTPDTQGFTDIVECISDPKRPLYLGASDDLVEIYDIKIDSAIPVKSSTFHSIVPFELGKMLTEARVVQLPVRYEYQPDVLHRELFYFMPQVETVGNKIPDQPTTIELDRPIEGYQVKDRVVQFVSC